MKHDKWPKARPTGLGLGAIPATLAHEVKADPAAPARVVADSKRRRGFMDMPKLMRIVLLAAATSSLLVASGAGQQGTAPQAPESLNAALTLPNPPRVGDAELSRLRDGLAAAENSDWTGPAQLPD